MKSKKTYHFGRKLRQLKSLKKQLKLDTFSKLSDTAKNKILAKFTKLVFLFKNIMGTKKLTRLIGVAALSLLIQYNTQAQTSVFAPPVENPFNIEGHFSNFDNRYLHFNFADLDADGDLDILALESDDICGFYDLTSLFYFENKGNFENPLYELDTTYITDFRHLPYVYSIYLWDIDEDGDLDIMVSGADCSSLGPPYLGPAIQFHIINSGDATNPNFELDIEEEIANSWMLIQDTSATFSIGALAFGEITDIDNNGSLDILGYHESRVYYPDGSDDYYEKYSLIYLQDIVASDTFTYDDAGISGYNYSTEDSVFAFLGTQKTISSESSPIINQTGNFLYDINNDGLKDVFGFEQNFGSDSIYITQQFNESSNGVIAFGDVLILDTLITDELFRPHFIDFDNDNDVDIMSIFDGKMKYYENLTYFKRKITGKTYVDRNINNMIDSLEEVSNITILSQPNQILTASHYDGSYSFTVDSGTYKISVIPPQHWTVTPDTLIATITSTNDTASGINFKLTPDNVQDLSINMNGTQAWWGFQRSYWINYKNKVNEVENVVIELVFDDGYNFVYANPSPNSVNSNVATWNFSELQPLESGNIKLSLEVDQANQVGDTLQSQLVINPTTGDINIEDNTFAFEQIVLGSYDPNDKLVHPSEEFVSINQEEYTYTIRFQNTGEAPALNIVIKDTIDADFDINSFQLINSSHPEKLTTIIDENRIATFTFNNIFLPDSTNNEVESHGFIKYSLAPLTTISDGTEFTNTAHITFDINEPITTNTTSNTVDIASSTITNDKQLKVEIFPNPFSETAHLSFKNLDAKLFILKIFDVNGQLLSFLETRNDFFQISAKNLSSGFYVFELSNGEENINGKMVIE